MVPLAVGTQTNGSVIRPASFCGVVGFKPSRGLISRRGILAQSATLDQVGTFSRTIEDAALLADALAGHDDRDPQHLAVGAAGPARDSDEPAAREARLRAGALAGLGQGGGRRRKEGFAELAEALGDDIDEVELPEPFARAHDWHRTINLAELARNYARYYDKDPARLERQAARHDRGGPGVRAVDYIRALDGIAILNAGLEKLFERYDAIVTPAATGEAPVGLAHRRSGLLHALDLLRRAGADAAAAHRAERHAGRRAARRPPLL